MADLYSSEGRDRLCFLSALVSVVVTFAVAVWVVWGAVALISWLWYR